LRAAAVRVLFVAAVRTNAVFPVPAALEAAVVFPAAALAPLEAILRRFFFAAAGEAALSAFAEQAKPRKHESARTQDIVP
jgi:hypothetical protein